MFWFWKRKSKDKTEPEQAAPAVSPRENNIAAAARQPDPEPPELAMLTPRERHVFALLLTGIMLKEITSGLGVKFSTVNSHCKAIYRKLQVDSRTELMAYYGVYPVRKEAGK